MREKVLFPDRVFLKQKFKMTSIVAFSNSSAVVWTGLDVRTCIMHVMHVHNARDARALHLRNDDGNS